MRKTPFASGVRSAASAAAALLLGGEALADRAIVALEQTVSAQSNLFRTSDNEESDASYQVRPRLRFLRPHGEVEYDFEYSPAYNVFFRTDGIDGFDHFGRTRVSWAPSPLGKFYIGTDLAEYRSIRSNTVEGPGGNPEIVPDVSGRVFRAIADAGYEHSFSALTSAEAAIAMQSYQYSTENNTDSVGVGGEVNLLRKLGPTLELGGMLFASHRRFDELDEQPSSTNTVFHGGPMLRLTPAPALTIEVEAGPALVITDRDSGDAAGVARFRTVGTQAAVFPGCGQVASQPILSLCPLQEAGGFLSFLQGQTVVVDYAPGGRPLSQDDDRLTAFGRLGVRKDESWGYASLDYLRGEDASSGNNATTIRDSLTATVSVGNETRWNVRFRANWNQRETVDRIDETEVVAGPSGVLSFAEAEGLVVTDREKRKVTQFWGEVTLRRQLTKSIAVELEGRHLQQDKSGSDSSDDDFDNWRGSVMVLIELPHLDYGW